VTYLVLCGREREQVKIRKYHLTVPDEQEIPKTGDIGYPNIEIYLRLDIIPFLRYNSLDVDITSEDSIYDSFKEKLSYSGVYQLKPFLKSNLALILPGIWCECCTNWKEYHPNPKYIEVFSALKDVPEFVKFRKDNNYPESSLALNESHRPLTHKDMNFIKTLLPGIEIANDIKFSGVVKKVFYLMPDKLFISNIKFYKDVIYRRTWFSVGESQSENK